VDLQVRGSTGSLGKLTLQRDCASEPEEDFADDTCNLFSSPCAFQGFSQLSCQTG
jgi:hypothetical protein